MVTDRAYLKGARIGPGLARFEAEVERIMAALGGPEAARVDADILQPADLLLDLYGEDIRARAFTTRDDGAEMMLRPDFTLPVARLHMASQAEAAQYVYCGPVWRRQEFGSDRPREYVQAGLELFGQDDAAAADAEVLVRVQAALGAAPVTLITGDMGLAIAAVEALETSAVRRAALRRHLWRPARFQELLRRYGAAHAGVTAGRADLLAAVDAGRVSEAIEAAGTVVGLRSVEEVVARAERLSREAAQPPLTGEAVARLEAVLALKGSCDGVLADLRRMVADMPKLDRAVNRFEARLAAFRARGIDPDGLAFEGSFGRTTLEYYDGFVFGAVAMDRPDLPPVASGGRYDALTRVLGQGEGVAAVGGMIRPEALMSLSEGAE